MTNRDEEPLYKADPACRQCKGTGSVVFDSEAGREYDDCDCLAPDTAPVSLGNAVESEAALPQFQDDEHYQLYKLLAYAIQELDWFANDRNISDTLALPHPERIIKNRAKLAVERLINQEPHFFRGYAAYSRGCSEAAIESTEQAQAVEGLGQGEDTNAIN